MEDKNLKDRSYYERRYNAITISECKRHILPLPKEEKMKQKDWDHCISMALWSVKGEMAINKEETINKWMEDDRELDKKLARANPVTHCDICRGEMKFSEKSACNSSGRIEFWFYCPKCKISKHIYEDGSEVPPIVLTCPECDTRTKTRENKIKGKKYEQMYCPKCKWEEDVLYFENLEKRDKKRAKTYQEDCREFCLTSKETESHIETKKGMEELIKMFEEIDDEDKEGTPAYKLKHLERLTVSQIKDKIVKVISKKKFPVLEFEKPEYHRDDIILGASVQDDADNRSDWQSIKDMKTAISKSLDNTNWKLMAEGVSYQMGVLQFRLRGTEGKGRLKEIIK